MAYDILEPDQSGYDVLEPESKDIFRGPTEFEQGLPTQLETAGQGFSPEIPSTDLSGFSAFKPEIPQEKPPLTQSEIIRNMGGAFGGGTGITPEVTLPQSVEALTKPFIKLPEATAETVNKARPLMGGAFGGGTGITPQEDFGTAATAALLNNVKGIVEFAESPAGVATAGLGAGGSTIQKLIGLGFSADIASKIPAAMDAAANAETPEEKGTAYANLAATLGMAVAPALPAIKSVFEGTKPPTTGEVYATKEGIQQESRVREYPGTDAQRQTAEASNRNRPVGSPPSETLPPQQPQAVTPIKRPEKGLPESATASDLMADMTEAGRNAFREAKSKPDEFTSVDVTDLSNADRRNLARLGLSFSTDRSGRVQATYPARMRQEDLRKAVQAKQVSTQVHTEAPGQILAPVSGGQPAPAIRAPGLGGEIRKKFEAGELRTEEGAVPIPGGGITIVNPALKDIYGRFEPGKKSRPSISGKVSQGVEAVRTGLASKFRPIDKLAEDIAKETGKPTPSGIAGIFEAIKGSSGKAEADIYRFDQDVSKPLRGNERNFNAYMLLRRSLDRLQQDAAEGTTRRGVSNYTIPELQNKLAILETELGPERTAAFKDVADKYQQHLDDALRLQVESGRMSPTIYSEIKNGNQFYAPFKVMKYLEETSRPEGTGKRIDTLAEFTKAMEGITDPNFKLGDMLGAARQNIMLSRILAEKNRAMLNLSKLAGYDTAGKFIKKLKSTEDIPQGMEAVNVLEGGKPERYAVNPDVAQAVQLYGKQSQNIILQAMGAVAVPFRAGATALNIPFQVSNLLADQPRAALISKYGVRGATDLVRYPLDFVHSLYSSIVGDMFGAKNKLFLDFLDSGVAGSTVQETLTPRALSEKPYSAARTAGRNILWAVPDFAKAIEQTSKILGVKRAMRFEGVKSGKELAAKIPEAVTELRRFSGSPDFGRQGKWVEQARLNIIYMFFNARLQGATADIGRLIGRDSAGTAAKTWLKLATAVGIPTVYAYLLNHDSQYADDYEKRPQQEKQNYWLIPKDSFITTSDGQKIRDYWRIPKRESAKWIANMTESAMDFARSHDPENFGKFAVNMMEDISPVNIQGKTFQERIESTATSLNPLIKAPIELAAGRDMYRHRDIVPDQMKKASPELQYTDRTAEVFKSLANAMPNNSPEVFRSPLMMENLTRNLTAGLITQFLPAKPIEGRSGIASSPLLQRFQALPIEDRAAFDAEMNSMEREAADEQLNRHRTALKLLSDNKGKDLESIAESSVKQFGDDPKLIRHLVDLYVANERGVTGEERQLLGLPAKQRAAYIFARISGQPPEVQDQILEGFASKRIFTQAVAPELEQLIESASRKPTPVRRALK